MKVRFKKKQINERRERAAKSLAKKGEISRGKRETRSGRAKNRQRER